MIDYIAFKNQMLDGYRASYDVNEYEEAHEDGTVAFLHMHMEQIQKFIMKDFQMSAADADEYVYVYRIPQLTEEKAAQAIQNAYDDGFPRIKLEHVTFRHQHMCTRLVALFICDECDEAAMKKIKKCRIQKSFQFSLKGWMEVHAVAVQLKDGSVVSNPLGRETAKYMKMHVKHYCDNMQK